jgi:hypothetical protein
METPFLLKGTIVLPKEKKRIKKIIVAFNSLFFLLIYYLTERIVLSTHYILL